MCTNDEDHVIITIEMEKPVPSMDEDLQEQLQHRRQGKVYSNRTIAMTTLVCYKLQHTISIKF